MKVLVTGAYGQLGQSIQHISNKYPELDFIFFDLEDLDITNLENCKEVFNTHKPDFCINTAAYTAVDKAESDVEMATKINVIGAKNLAEVSRDTNTILFHISTDFVFDGTSSKPYSEDDLENPLGIYGKTKLEGEKIIQKIWQKHIIIRTSWVYSQFANNFMKTMLRLASERDEINVVNDQIGTPTYAVDLADVIIQLILKISNFKFQESNLYNFSNEGYCSWYDFTKEIFRQKDIQIKVNPIPSSSYPTPAKRPTFSVLDKSKIKKEFHLEILDWKESLKKALF